MAIEDKLPENIPKTPVENKYLWRVAEAESGKMYDLGYFDEPLNKEIKI